MEFLREHVVRTLRSLLCRSLTVPSQLPLTRSFPGPRSVIIMDNARIHHSDEITELVEEVYGAFQNPSTRIQLTISVYQAARIEYLPALFSRLQSYRAARLPVI